MVYIKIMRIKLRHIQEKKKKRKKGKAKSCCDVVLFFWAWLRIRRPPGKVNYQLPVANVAMINGEPAKIITRNKVNKIMGKKDVSIFMGDKMVGGEGGGDWPKKKPNAVKYWINFWFTPIFFLFFSNDYLTDRNVFLIFFTGRLWTKSILGSNLHAAVKGSGLEDGAE